ncbi:MAG: hypothetical protein PHQ40_11080 [Anaerolineaceae bacterium]|nr:hypothetical protein [Anaerolineaceae bacterium]
MKSKIIVLSGVLAGLILGAIALSNGALLNNQHALAAADSTEVISLMLTSHQKWQAIQGKAEITYYVNNGTEKQSLQETFAYTGDGRAYSDLIDTTGANPVHSSTFVAEKGQMYFVDWVNKSYRQETQRNFQKILDRLPSDLSKVKMEDNGGPVIVRHPMAQYGQDPLLDYLFPTGLAQRNGDYKLVGNEKLLNRDVFVVDFAFTNSDGQTIARYWVDQETGVILQVNNFSAERKGELLDEVKLTAFQVNDPIESLIKIPDTNGLKKTDQP